MKREWLTGKTGAILSEEEPNPLFRYVLWRSWDETLPVLVWVMLNPSTADHTVDDPTIKRCIGFAKRLGYGSIMVVNLFAFRSPHPKAMQAAEDAIGPQNDAYLEAIFEEVSEYGGDIVAAWGTGGAHLERDYQVAEMVEGHGNVLMCLGKSKDGHPKHPLARGLHRIPDDSPLIPLRANDGAT